MHQGVSVHVVCIKVHELPRGENTLSGKYLTVFIFCTNETYSNGLDD